MPLSPFRRLAKSFRAVFAALAMAVLLSPALASAQGSYRLGPGDLISVRVLGWDALNLEFVVYDALGGEFTVDGDGNVNLPLLGLVLAMGIDVAELSDDIGRRYQARLGLAEAPSAAVEVAEYRPIYILGDVSQPGRYPFEPGLTPIRAVALAGGLFRLIDQNENGEATATRMIGNLDEVRGDLARQRMRAVRLRAELAEANFDLPEDMPRHPDGDAAQVVLFDHEASLFDGRAQQLSNAIASIDESRNLLRTEVAALEEKQTGIARQLVLIRESLGNLEQLRERGLARSPALVDLQRTLIDLEARELDAETATFRARQRLTELDRELADLVARREVETLEDLQTTEAEMARLEARQSTWERLLSGAEAQMATESVEIGIRLEYNIQRENGDTRETIEADETTPLMPLDVLQVEAITILE